MEKLKVGILGTANIAQRMVAPALLQMEEFDLVCVGSRSKEKAEAFAKRFGCKAVQGYQAVLEEDLDAVYIPLPVALHEEWVAHALHQDKHVLCEKSLATNLEEVSSMTRLAKQKGKVLLENFMFLCHSQQQFLLHEIRKKNIGEIRVVRVSFGFPPFPDPNNIRYQKDLGGGALLDAGCYTVKAAQMILGTGLQVVSGTLNYNDKGVDIHGAICLRADNGVVAQLAFGFDHFYQCKIDVWGSKGRLVADRAFTAGPGFRPKISMEFQDETKEHTLPADNHFKNMLKHFHTCIVENQGAAQLEAILDQARLMQGAREHAG